MIDLLRGRQLSFESPLGVSEVTARLRREIAAPGTRPLGDRTGLFEGTFADGRFRMLRLVHGRNSMRPVISGHVSQGRLGARIDARVQLHPAVTVFLGSLLVVSLAVATVAVPLFVESGRLSPPLVFALFSAGLFVVFAIAAAGEARRASRMLAELVGTDGPEPRRAD